LLFFRTVTAYEQTAAIKAAIELDLFTAVAQGKQSAAELAQHMAATERGIRILCDYLVVLGFMTKQDSRYGLTLDTATFLDRRSPAYAGGVIQFMLSPQITGGFDDLTGAVRGDGTFLKQQGTVAPEHPVWVRFAKAMAPMMALPAQQLAALVNGDSDRKIKVLDIAAGHGLFGIALAKRNPSAEIVALDWPQVLEVAEQNAWSAGLDDRFSTLPGSAFDVDFGTGYDVVLLTNFLHHFDVAGCETLLKKVHAALVDGGKAVALEFIPDENRTSPVDAAVFALTMLATTPSGDAYTFSEYERMFRNAGFSKSELHPLPPTMQRVVIASR
jgi:2-polyprenyl-3-methyl-5-hydroxy-6-metoxy-1,4-benzoquinol methylase